MSSNETAQWVYFLFFLSFCFIHSFFCFWCFGLTSLYFSPAYLFFFCSFHSWFSLCCSYVSVGKTVHTVDLSFGSVTVWTHVLLNLCSCMFYNKGMVWHLQFDGRISRLSMHEEINQTVKITTQSSPFWPPSFYKNTKWLSAPCRERESETCSSGFLSATLVVCARSCGGHSGCTGTDGGTGVTMPPHQAQSSTPSKDALLCLH